MTEQMRKKLVKVSQFLKQYERAQTRRSYRNGIKQFLELFYPNLKIELEEKRKELGVTYIPVEIVTNILDSYAIQYLEEDRDHREDLLNFRDSLGEKAPTTRRSRINAIRVFLDDNGITFPKRFFKNVNGKNTEAITWEKIPSNEELKRIVEYLPVQGKVLTLFLSSSGMRIGEAVQLKLKDLEFNRDPVRIKIRGEYTKTGKRRITFISPEAKEAVEEWLKYRERYTKRARGRTPTKFRREDRVNCLFPFRGENFNTIWRNGLIKAGLLEIDEKTNRMTMRPHNLRKFFRLRVGRYGRDEAEALMGHQQGLNKIYANFAGAEERLEEVYKKAIPDLSIYQRGVHVAQENEELKNKIKEFEDNYDKLKKNELENKTDIAYLMAKIGDLRLNDENQRKEIEELKKKGVDQDQRNTFWEKAFTDLDETVGRLMAKEKQKRDSEKE